MRSEQKLARQAKIFLNCGGQAMTALLRMLLLSVAIVFERIGGVCLVLETLIGNDAREAERARKSSPVRAITFTAMPKRKAKPIAGNLRP